VAALGAERVDIRDRAAHAGLHQSDSQRAGSAVEHDLVERVFAVRIEAVEHEVRAEARHRHRRVAARLQATVEFGQTGARRDQQREGIGEAVLGIERAGPAVV